MNPCNYNEAIQDKDATLWQKVMNTKMESMYSNQVQSLVYPPNGIKSIGCNRKRGIDGKVKTFKARLVAKGYTRKKASIMKTFLLVAMIKSIMNPLLHIWIIRYDKWTSRQLSLMEVLMRPFIWSNQKDSLQMAKKRKCASCKSPFGDFSRHLDLGTSNLTNWSSNLDLSNVLMSLVCIRGAAKM